MSVGIYDANSGVEIKKYGEKGGLTGSAESADKQFGKQSLLK